MLLFSSTALLILGTLVSAAELQISSQQQQPPSRGGLPAKTPAEKRRQLRQSASAAQQPQQFRRRLGRDKTDEPTPTPTAAPSAPPTPAPFAPTSPAPVVVNNSNATTTAAPSSSRSPVVPPTLPPTFDNDLNAAPVELATFVVPVTVQLDSMSQAGTEEVDPAVIAAVYREELRKTLQIYLKEQMSYQNLVFVQLNTTRRRPMGDDDNDNCKSNCPSPTTARPSLPSRRPTATTVVAEQTTALQDATAIRAAVQRNEILREATVTAGLTLGEITVVEDTNDRDAQDQSPDGGTGDDDNSDSQAGLIGGLVAAAVLMALVAAFLVRRRKNLPPPPLITTTHKQKQQPQQPFSPYGKEETEESHDHIVADLHSLEEEQQNSSSSSKVVPTNPTCNCRRRAPWLLRQV